MVVGTVLQHLVGAKLQVALEGRADVEHHGANVNDVKSRAGTSIWGIRLSMCRYRPERLSC